MIFAYDLHKANDGGAKGAFVERIAALDVDTHLHREKVGRQIAYHPRDHRFQMTVPAIAQAGEVQAVGAGHNRRPGVGGTRRRATMADRAAVGDPAWPVIFRRRQAGAIVKGQRPQTKCADLWQPKLDPLLARRQPRKGEHRFAGQRHGAMDAAVYGEIYGCGVGLRHDLPGNGGGSAAEGQAHTSRHRRPLLQRYGRKQLASRVGQPPRHHPVGGVLHGNGTGPRQSLIVRPNTNHLLRLTPRSLRYRHCGGWPSRPSGGKHPLSICGEGAGG